MKNLIRGLAVTAFLSLAGLGCQDKVFTENQDLRQQNLELQQQLDEANRQKLAHTTPPPVPAPIQAAAPTPPVFVEPPPAATPAPALAENRQPLPLPDQSVTLPSFYYQRPALDILIAKVQVSFNASEKEYKAREFDKARADYDRAVALLVASGYQSDSDPRLSDLIDQIGETLHSYDVNARQDAGDEEENPSTPAPIEAWSRMVSGRGGLEEPPMPGGSRAMS